jgi:prefoldin subunit 5
MSRHDITSMYVSEIIERVNPKEYKNYISSEFAASSISHLEKNIDNLNTQIIELDSKKERHEKTMERISPGSTGIASLKPILYHKHLELSSIMSIEDAIRKISRASIELDKISASRESLIRQRGKVNTQIGVLMKEFNAVTKEMEVAVRKYNLRNYLSSMVDTNEIERLIMYLLPTPPLYQRKETMITESTPHINFYQSQAGNTTQYAF